MLVGISMEINPDFANASMPIDFKFELKFMFLKFIQL